MPRAMDAVIHEKRRQNSASLLSMVDSLRGASSPASRVFGDYLSNDADGAAANDA